MPLFTQLGIIDQVVAKAKISRESFMYNQNMKQVLYLDYHTDLAEK
jgi:hypothetical protein